MAKKWKNKKTFWKILKHFEENSAPSNPGILAKPKLDKSVVVGLDDGVEKETPFPIAIAGIEDVLDDGKHKLQNFSIDVQTEISNAHHVLANLPERKFSEIKWAVHHESDSNLQKNTKQEFNEMAHRKLPQKQGAANDTIDRKNSRKQGAGTDKGENDKSYAGRRKNSRDPDAGFQLVFDPTLEDNIVILPEEILDVGNSFGYALVGYFPSGHPGQVGLDRIVTSWKAPTRVIPNVNGWITFVFKTERDRDMVIAGGPYMIFGRILLLKLMPEWFKFGNDEIKTLPLWVKFPNLPLECWNAQLLSRIASKVGTPLLTDKMTKTMERISYARVLVEVDASKELVRSVSIIDSKGNRFDQLVEFETKPAYCQSCHSISHVATNCKRSGKTMGIEKGAAATVPAPKTNDQPQNSIGKVPAATLAPPPKTPNKDAPDAISNSKLQAKEEFNLKRVPDIAKNTPKNIPNRDEGSTSIAQACPIKPGEGSATSSFATDEIEFVQISEQDSTFQIVGKKNRVVKLTEKELKARQSDQNKCVKDYSHGSTNLTFSAE
ncbi:hypothetical protein PHJA_002082100 [Phtheirospermum japonicum]|uniref:DUF4283 domain-containing protein n=1 Tax=Phtheirospermum japonicum TaxID=374723 RepID=A0A830CI29_9LAMI|nr:hypothetical protein PHJA_002082100 [Phtheirospermum japonicum]